ncbi:YdcH family protein [Varunaivibrio sulfuroxidans]
MDAMTEKSLSDDLEELKIEHRDLDDVIAHLIDDPASDRILLQRLKKRKLALKDQIAKMQSLLVPDIIA